MFELPQHGVPTAGEVSLQDHPEPCGVLRVDHLTAQVPEEEVADALVAESSLEKEASEEAVVMGLKLQCLYTHMTRGDPGKIQCNFRIKTTVPEHIIMTR